MPEATSADHAANLKAAQESAAINSPKTAKKNTASTFKNLSLLSHINPFIDWLFGIAFILAILKDVLDIINTALIAAGGAGEILIFIFTSLISIFIFLIIVITGSAGKVKIARGIVKKIGLLIGTAIVEMIPAIGLLPLESVLVMVIFWMTLRERKKGTGKKTTDGGLIHSLK